MGVDAVEAYVDSQAINALDDENVYYYKNGNYATLTGTVDATTNNPRIEFSGARCKAYFALSSSGFTDSTSGTATHRNEANLPNGDFSDTSICTLTADTGGYSIVNYAMPQIPKLGEYVGITALTKFGIVLTGGSAGSLSGANTFLIGNVAYGTGNVTLNAELSNSIASVFSGETDSWNFEGTLAYKLLAATTDLSVQVVESGIVVEFDIDEIESHEFQELYEALTYTAGIEISHDEAGDTFQDSVIKTRTTTINTPSEVDYVYCSGKGRKYGAWIDTIDSNSRTSENGDAPDPNYGTSDFIENPVYIIEDILRTELGLDDSTDGSDIDIESFDNAVAKQTETSGTTKKGDISLIFNDAIADIQFAFSQYKFINSKDLINRLCKQMLSWVFIGGDGKFKINTK